MTHKKPDYASYKGTQARPSEPNWKRHGFKSKEEGAFHVIGTLMSQAKMLMKKGLGEALTIQYRGNTYFIDSKKK